MAVTATLLDVRHEGQHLVHRVKVVQGTGTGTFTGFGKVDRAVLIAANDSTAATLPDADQYVTITAGFPDDTIEIINLDDGETRIVDLHSGPEVDLDITS